jgi:hypothetical protein
LKSATGTKHENSRGENFIFGGNMLILALLACAGELAVPKDCTFSEEPYACSYDYEEAFEQAAFFSAVEDKYGPADGGTELLGPDARTLLGQPTCRDNSPTVRAWVGKSTVVAAMWVGPCTHKVINFNGPDGAVEVDAESTVIYINTKNAPAGFEALAKAPEL